MNTARAIGLRSNSLEMASELGRGYLYSALYMNKTPYFFLNPQNSTSFQSIVKGKICPII
jgi:hypothetical protein